MLQGMSNKPLWKCWRDRQRQLVAAVRQKSAYKCLESSEFLLEPQNVSQLLHLIVFCLVMHLCSVKCRAVREAGVLLLSSEQE